MEQTNKYLWCPKVYWDKYINSENKFGCANLIQIFGWKLLSKYLNGGLGRSWLLFPYVKGISKDLTERAIYLENLWVQYLKCFGVGSIKKPNLNRGLECFIIDHYNMLKYIIDFNKTKNKLKIQVVNKDIWKDHKHILKICDKMENIQPYLHSYWFHGSVGSNEIKNGWSDVDGLAIVSEKTFDHADNLKYLRQMLINSRTQMVDFWPYQMHGHFILSEIDLQNYPTPMFPSVLFKNAKCINSKNTKTEYLERYDSRMALEALWVSGISDLLGATGIERKDTLYKISILHRMYLLPCLIFQLYGKPSFKKYAFTKLDEIFTDKEINTIDTANTIWKTWVEPSKLIRISIKFNNLMRFNALGYQKCSHILGKNLPWLINTKSIDWRKLGENINKLAENVWLRAVNYYKKCQ